jgi:hypothetical protein
MSAAGRENSDSEAGAGERVRFCLQCGEVLAFDAARCPACGAEELLPPARAEAGAQQPCPACGRPKPASLLFCPHCGVDVGASPVAARPVAGVPQRTGTAVATASVVLAILAPLLALLVLLELMLPDGLG